MIHTTYVHHEVPVITRDDLVTFLNEDLAIEYQAILSYLLHSQVLVGAQYMNVAFNLKKYAADELAHALIIAGQINYLGGVPLVVPKPVKTSVNVEDLLRFDLENETESIERYRQRARQCEALRECAMAQRICEILVQEQDHQIALAKALGVEIPHLQESSEVGGDSPTEQWPIESINHSATILNLV